METHIAVLKDEVQVMHNGVNVEVRNFGSMSKPEWLLFNFTTHHESGPYNNLTDAIEALNQHLNIKI